MDAEISDEEQKLFIQAFAGKITAFDLCFRDNS